MSQISSLPKSILKDVLLQIDITQAVDMDNHSAIKKHGNKESVYAGKHVSILFACVNIYHNRTYYKILTIFSCYNGFFLGLALWMFGPCSDT